MLKKLKEKIKEEIKLKKAGQKQFYQDIANSFDDEIALITEWCPLKVGGANFKTHKLARPSSTLLQYRLSFFVIILISIFGAIGIAALVGGLYTFIDATISTNWVILTFGVLFFIASLLIYNKKGKNVFFDLSKGTVSKRYKQHKLSGNLRNTDLIYINDIYAVQIIKELVKAHDKKFFSYEINLVMHNGSRVNLIDHSNYLQINIDAIEISSFLGKKLWDSVELKYE